MWETPPPGATGRICSQTRALEPTVNLDVRVSEGVLRRIEIERVSDAPSVRGGMHADREEDARDEWSDHGDLADVVERNRHVAKAQQESLRQAGGQAAIEVRHGQVGLVVARVDERHQLPAWAHQRRKGFEGSRRIGVWCSTPQLKTKSKLSGRKGSLNMSAWRKLNVAGPGEVPICRIDGAAEIDGHHATAVLRGRPQ